MAWKLNPITGKLDYYEEDDSAIDVVADEAERIADPAPAVGKMVYQSDEGSIYLCIAV